MIRELARVEKILSVKPLRTVVIGLVECSTFAWPFKRAAHGHGFRFMVDKGNRVFWRQVGGAHRL